MPKVSRVLFVESHNSAWTIRPDRAAEMNQVQPSDSGYVLAAEFARAAGFEVVPLVSGEITDAVLQDVDLVVLPHSSIAEFEKTVESGSPVLADSEILSLRNFVDAGGGLLVFAETEQLKYQNNFNQLTETFGIRIENTTVLDPQNCFKDVAAWIKPQGSENSKFDLLAKVKEAVFYRSGSLRLLNNAAFPILQAAPTADPANAIVAAGVESGSGRLVVVADSDIFGDDSIRDVDNARLWINLLMWLTPRNSETSTTTTDVTYDQAAWEALAQAIETIRPWQRADGSIDFELIGDSDPSGAVRIQVEAIKTAINRLAPAFPHQSEQLNKNIEDFDKWLANDCQVPDFLDSLMLFAPEAHRIHGQLNLSVFPMYTQNGNRNRNFEAVITRTFWPEMVAELEASKYRNPAFVPIEFVEFTKGYDTHSAVLFPETVATREVPTFTWGGIFCDREAARFRVVSKSAAELLKLALPPDAELLLSRQLLAQETFVQWDLIHDRTHSHGDLPFDPFMIKQRMPFWMYALEELRCDLNTYKETQVLEAAGNHYAPFIRYAILFDRLFRFPITGERVRNYDGLGGQLMFAWLHKQGILNWTDNILSFEWDRVDSAIVELCDAVNDLYRDSIDRSRIAHWLSAYEFVSAWVAPHPTSNWAKGIDGLDAGGEVKAVVDQVLPDEFPLNVFYEALRTKLSPTIASVSGITGK